MIESGWPVDRGSADRASEPTGGGQAREGRVRIGGDPDSVI
jgi:hypothetical protein